MAGSLANSYCYKSHALTAIEQLILVVDKFLQINLLLLLYLLNGITSQFVKLGL